MLLREGRVPAVALIAVLTACAQSVGATDGGPDGGASGEARRLALGATHTCLWSADGIVRCWGFNRVGQIGDGTTGGNRLTPARVAGVEGVVEIAGGGEHTCVRLATGVVNCWGGDGSGQLGDGPQDGTSRGPVLVTMLTGAVEIAAGGGNACARLADGTVRCWGTNDSGQLGDGTGEPYRDAPAPVATIAGAVEIGVGNHHSCARLVDGTVRCWGWNLRGQLGDGTTGGQRGTPVAVASLSGVVQLAVGGVHTCARLTDGTVRCWGMNGYGQLGAGALDDERPTPTPVVMLTDAVEITAGEHHTCALRRDRTVWCWGRNDDGELGTGALSLAVPAPSRVRLPGDAVEVRASNLHTCARLADASVYCWGNDLFGEIGDGRMGDLTMPDPATDGRPTPVRVMGL